MTPSALAGTWRTRACQLERYAPSAAEAFRTAAAELEEAVQAAHDEALTLDRAATESGYSKRRLRELVAEGRIPNAGRKHAPRIRRGDLPSRARGAPEAESYDVDADADALIGRLAS